MTKTYPIKPMNGTMNQQECLVDLGKWNVDNKLQCITLEEKRWTNRVNAQDGGEEDKEEWRSRNIDVPGRTKRQGDE